MVSEITPRQLADRLKADAPPLVIDVREPWENALCRIEGSELRPMSQASAWLKELDPEVETVFYCHTGQRSYQVTAFLAGSGFKKVHNLTGGIEAWSLQVDPTVRRY